MPIGVYTRTKPDHKIGKPGTMLGARCMEGCTCGKHNATHKAAPGYCAIHYRLGHEKRGFCVFCQEPKKRTDMALIHGCGDRMDMTRKGLLYSINPDDYQELCHPCHVRYDNEHHQA